MTPAEEQLRQLDEAPQMHRPVLVEPRIASSYHVYFEILLDAVYSLYIQCR